MRWIPPLLVAGVLAAGIAQARTFSEVVAACDLSGTPSSVVADVYDALNPTSLLATIPNGEVKRAASTTCYTVDLAATAQAISFPAASNPAEKIYLVIFRDDASNERRAVAAVVGYAGAQDRSCERETPIYSSTPIPERGLTLALINAGHLSYMKIDVDCARAWSPPARTYYLIPTYNANGTVASWTPSLTIPSP